MLCPEMKGALLSAGADLGAHFNEHIKAIELLKQHDVQKNSDYKFDVTSVYAWQEFANVAGIAFAAVTNPFKFDDKTKKGRLQVGATVRQLLEQFHGFYRLESGIPDKSMQDIKRHARFPGLARTAKLKPEIVKYSNDSATFDYYCTNPDTFACVQDTAYGKYHTARVVDMCVMMPSDDEINNNDKFATAVVERMKELNIKPWHPVMSEYDCDSFEMTIECWGSDDDCRLVGGNLWIDPTIKAKKLANILDTKNDV